MALDNLKEGMVLARSEFSPSNRAIIAAAGTVVTLPVIQKLTEHGVTSVVVEDEAAAAPPPPPPDPAPERAATPIVINRRVVVPSYKQLIDEGTRKEALDSIEQLFTSVSAGDEGNLTTAYQSVKRIDNVVDHLVSTLTRDSNVLINIEDLRGYDEYTYHHSLSVAVLSIAIGQSLGLPVRRLNEIGKCAMLHDIGKTAIPLEIINKPSRLDDNEFALIKTHSAKSYEYVKSHLIGSEELWSGVLCHHEKIDGTGYPNGYKGMAIPELSRIIAVADVYDALTSYRSYRKPMPAYEALEFMMAGVDNSFDYDIVVAFIRKLEPYPVGSFVELSDGSVAVVTDCAHALRPTLCSVRTGNTLELCTDKRLQSLLITRLIDNPQIVRSA